MFIVEAHFDRGTEEFFVDDENGEDIDDIGKDLQYSPIVGRSDEYKFSAKIIPPKIEKNKLKCYKHGICLNLYPSKSMFMVGKEST